MSAAVCGERHPSIAGRVCTRPEGHAGGHRDEPRDCYWQGEERLCYCGDGGVNGPHPYHGTVLP